MGPSLGFVTDVFFCRRAVETIRDFKIQILQTTDYGWTWAYHIEGPGSTTEQTARKYEIKMADNRQQTAALRLLLCPKCLSKKFDIRLSIAWQTMS